MPRGFARTKISGTTARTRQCNRAGAKAVSFQLSGCTPRTGLIISSAKKSRDGLRLHRPLENQASAPLTQSGCHADQVRTGAPSMRCRGSRHAGGPRPARGNRKPAAQQYLSCGHRHPLQHAILSENQASPPACGLLLRQPEELLQVREIAVRAISGRNADLRASRKADINGSRAEIKLAQGDQHS